MVEKMTLAALRELPNISPLVGLPPTASSSNFEKSDAKLNTFLVGGSTLSW
jgi:hypothetical protein